MGIRLNGEAVNYDPIEDLTEVKKDMKFFKDLAKNNRHNKDIYKLCMETIDQFAEQIARIEREGAII